MRITDDCQMDDGFINYLTFVFCVFGDKLVPLGLTLLVNIKNVFKIIIPFNLRQFGYLSYSLGLV
jgi:hypothetical protein